MNECIYCKSTDLQKDILVAAHTNNVALPYFTGGGGFLGIQVMGREPLLAELCKQCGTT